MQAAGFTLIKTSDFQVLQNHAEKYLDAVSSAANYKDNCECLSAEIEYQQSIEAKIARAKSILEILYWLLLMVLLIYIVRKQFFS